jgi:hypothetical protein
MGYAWPDDGGWPIQRRVSDSGPHVARSGWVQFGRRALARLSRLPERRQHDGEGRYKSCGPVDKQCQGRGS